MDPVISLLEQLVALDSVNPSLVPGASGEGNVAAFIAEHMRTVGLDVELQQVEAGRPNVIGVLEGRTPGRSLMFCGHTDTVGVEGMTDPWRPRQQNGRLYGRGAQDMKGGLAAMIDAARMLANDGFASGRLIVAAVIDEEFASLGADALVRRWTADAAVVTEPTDLAIGVGHKGFAWLEIETRGRAAHGSRPVDGRDAIFRMGRVLAELERLDRELQSRVAHPLMGTASLHASIIEGGREMSSYPDRCLLRMERRTVGGERAGAALEEVRHILERLHRTDREFDAEARAGLSRSSYEIAADHALPAALETAAAAAGVTARLSGLSFWTDAAILGGAGIPSVLFGPGGAGLHSTEEYVNVADVLACRNVLARFARQWC
ncbi:MAG TPA: M20/M25/M40 family metallo-hydrolase [Vicinamibacterales bacterium]|nr:M20/M25/M40 family metallo-hydrolase [Vicinamibacterales bacterium]